MIGTRPAPRPIIPTTARRAALAVALSFAAAVPGAAAVLDLTWTGQFAGFILQGQLAFDPDAPGENGVVRSDGFRDFD